MSEYPGVDLSIAMKAPKATISSVGNTPLPVVMRVDQFVAAVVGGIVGLFVGAAITGGSFVGAFISVFIFGGAGVFVVSWRDKEKNNILTRYKLYRRYRKNAIVNHLDGDVSKKTLFYIGCARIESAEIGFVHLQSSCAPVAPGSVDKDGVHVTKIVN